jgi:hypothetical protein
MDYASMWTILPMLLLWPGVQAHSPGPGLCCLCAALWLLLWPGLCGDSMCLPMLISLTHLWATIRDISFPVTSAPSTPGMHKGARQSNAQRQRGTRHSVPNSSQMCRQHRLSHNLLQPNEHPANGYGGSATATNGRHGRKGTWMRTNKKG